MWQVSHCVPNWVLPKAASPGNAVPEDEEELLDDDELLLLDEDELDDDELLDEELLDEELLAAELLLDEEELLDEELLPDEELLLEDELLLDDELLGATTIPEEELLDDELLEELLLDELLEDDELDEEELEDPAPVPELEELLDEEDVDGVSVSGGASGGELLHANKAKAKTQTAISFALSHITASHPWHLCRAAYSEYSSDDAGHEMTKRSGERIRRITPHASA